MYSILFTYIYHKNELNVGKCTIHGWYGMIRLTSLDDVFPHVFNGIARVLKTSPEVQTRPAGT